MSPLCLETRRRVPTGIKGAVNLCAIEYICAHDKGINVNVKTWLIRIFVIKDWKNNKNKRLVKQTFWGVAMEKQEKERT